jgi:hypothetical protein
MSPLSLDHTTRQPRPTPSSLSDTASRLAKGNRIRKGAMLGISSPFSGPVLMPELLADVRVASLWAAGAYKCGALARPHAPKLACLVAGLTGRDPYSHE